MNIISENFMPHMFPLFYITFKIYIYDPPPPLPYMSHIQQGMFIQMRRMYSNNSHVHIDPFIMF